ncbi:hypothetical protein K7432_003819 [Basidiobolus ranarum]|uniref:Uncharacterized protein n=1 Tax=Basidiobolus ranarum TaxID=34480 RepID=A0ABR2W646_9FUNG
MNRVATVIVTGWLLANAALCQTTLEHSSLSPSVKVSIAIESPTSAPIVNDPLYADQEDSHVPIIIIVAYICSGLIFAGLVLTLWYLVVHKKNTKPEEMSKYSPFEVQKKGEECRDKSQTLGQRLSKLTPEVAFFNPRESFPFGPRRTPSTTQLLSDTETGSIPQARTVEGSPNHKEGAWRLDEFKVGDKESNNTEAYARDSYRVW